MDFSARRRQRLPPCSRFTKGFLMMKYKDIAWDFDGTLYNSYPHIARNLRLTMEKFGYTDSEENILQFAHITTGHAYEHYAPLCGVTREEFVQEHHKLAYGPASDLVQPYPGIVELLRDIVAAGGRNHLCTNRKTDSCRLYFERDGIADCFDFYSGPDVAPEANRKPDPDLIKVILDARSIAPASLLMVGDRNLDIEAAHAAGSAGCFIDMDGFSTVTCNPEYQAANIDELRAILLG